MREIKKTVQFIAVLAFALFIFSGNAFSASSCKTTIMPGRYMGTDGKGGIIFTPPWNEICFITYSPVDEGSGSGSPDPIVATWIGSINFGLIDINGMTVDNVNNGKVYTPIKNENTKEVSTEKEVIDWMNANYGTNEP